jgi:haloacetate dehalogenase
MLWAGFEDDRVRIGDADYFVTSGGRGSPVVLLHGFPQTHVCWSRVAPVLAEDHRVLAVDLRGYGESHAPAGGDRGEGYSKREMAHELVDLIAALGHESFAVVGHDRGARVAYRAALDHPDRVTRVAVLNVVPTLDQFERMDAGASLSYWPWFLLAQPAPFPERLVGANTAALLDHAFNTWADDPGSIDGDHRAAYRRAMTAETIAAMCADYRAGFHIDRGDDAADREVGRRITVPVLLVTGQSETQLSDASDVWRGWTDELVTAKVPGGHFLPEESPRELIDVLVSFLQP